MMERLGSIESALEQFSADLDEAEMIAAEMSGRAPFEDFGSFNDLVGHEAEMMEALEQRYEVNLANVTPAKVEEIDGTEGTAGEGKITVSLFATNVPDVFIGKYEYADGSVGWTIQAFEVEE